MPNPDSDHKFGRDHEEPIKETSLKEKYELNNIKALVGFLDQGYKLSKLNEYSEGFYITELKNGEQAEVFSFKVPLPSILDSKSDLKGKQPSEQEQANYKTQMFKEQMEGLLAKMEVKTK